MPKFPGKTNEAVEALIDDVTAAIHRYLEATNDAGLPPQALDVRSSEQASALLADYLKSQIKPLPEDWKGPTQMALRYGNVSKQWEQGFERTLQILIEDIGDTLNISSEQAEAIVDKNLGGWRLSHGHVVLGASPDLVRISEHDQKDEKPPKMDPEWKTGAMMAREKGGTSASWSKQLRTTAQKITGDIAEGLNISLEEAADLVNRHLGGIRSKNRDTYDSLGAPPFSASPDLVRTAEEGYTPPKPRSRPNRYR